MRSIRTVRAGVAAAQRRGFTLAEMMVVIVILGLLATLVVPNVLGHFIHASTEKARADVVQLANALEQYAIRNAGKYPESLEALVQPDGNGHTCLNARVLPPDPWKHAYRYEPPSPGVPGSRPRIASDGPDGQAGNADDISTGG